MKKAFDRIAALCLSIAMLFSLTTVLSFAATEGTCGNDLTWKIENGTLTISGSGAMEDYTATNEAPWFEQRFGITKIKIGDDVTSIGNHAFSGLENAYTADCGNVERIGDFAFFCCVMLDSVTFGEGLKYIGEGAFANCWVLSQVEIPNTVETIGTGAFMGTCIEGDLVFGDALKTIGTMAFFMCYGITGVTISDSVESVGDSAFYGCEFVDHVSIGKSVRNIGELAFAYCTDLKEITVSSSNTHFKAVNNALLTKNGDTLLAYAIDSGNGVNVPNTVKKIKDEAFAGSHAITNVILPEGLETIGYGAFVDCWYLESVTLPTSLKTIGDFAFAGDFGITQFTVPKNVNYIGAGAFSEMYGISSFKVENGNSNYTVRDGVILSKDETVLVACPSGKMGNYAIPNTVDDICAYAFSGCSNLTVTIPNGVKTIGDGAFRYTFSMNNIIIPESVTYIGENAFGESGLGAINVANGNDVYTTVSGVLFTEDMKTLIYYPTERSRESYTIPEGVTEIADYAFEYSNITGITIPDSVTSIGNYAFGYCEDLYDISIGKNVGVIGENAFSDCYSLTDVELPYAVGSIGAYAFAWCEELDSVVIGGSPYIDICAFAWCGELDDVEFNAAAPADLGDMAFYGCSDVFVITYADGMADWTTPTWMGYDTKNDGKAAIIVGDVNGDGGITNSDLILIARHIVGIEETDVVAGDLNGDGTISNEDLITVARIIVGANR